METNDLSLLLEAQVETSSLTTW